MAIERAELTFGQLSVWRSMEGLPKQHWNVVSLPQVWQLPEGTSIAAVGEALDMLEQRHEALRTRYETTGDRGLIQAVWAPRGVRLEVLELGERAAELADRISHDLTELPLAPDTDPPLRARLITTNGVPVLLALSILHLAADGWALSQLRSELLDLLAGRDLEPAPSCLELAAEQHSAKWAARNEAAIDYWRRVVSEAPPVSADDRPGGPDSTRWAVTLRSTAALRTATELADYATVPISTVVLTAHCMTSAARTGRNEHLIGLLAGNRVDSKWQKLVTSMVQVAPMLFRHVEGEDFTATLRRVHWQTLIAYRHGIADVDGVDRAVRPYGRSSVGVGFHNMYNFLADLPGAVFTENSLAADAAAERRIEATSSKRNNGFPFYLNVHVGNTLTLYLQENSTAPDARATTRFVCDIEDLMESAANAVSAPADT
jgi:hypothetical protein